MKLKIPMQEYAAKVKKSGGDESARLPEPGFCLSRPAPAAQAFQIVSMAGLCHRYASRIDT